MKKQTWRQWGRAVSTGGTPSKLFKGAFGALTGQDARALEAIVACWELYSNSDEDGMRGALEAVRALLPAMQPSTRWIAREMIPFALCWDDRERLWPLVAQGGAATTITPGFELYVNGKLASLPAKILEGDKVSLRRDPV
jgi:hypothetical protein